MKTGLLLSGGMDSLSIAWWKRPDIAFTLDYGQIAAEAEIVASQAICRRLNIDHEIIKVDCSSLGSGDMAGTVAHRVAPASDWWPYRNQLLITLAATRAINFGATMLWLGTVKSDNRHKDGGLQFIDSISRLMSCQEGGISVEAPAINLSTAELVKVSGVPSELLAWAHSCHKASVACGNCRGCNKYFQTFEELGYELDRPW